MVDCAHAAGSVVLKLHEWEVDAAAWCNYKYLNSGPGSIAGIFIHEKHKDVIPGMRGWHGNSRKNMFKMD